MQLAVLGVLLVSGLPFLLGSNVAIAANHQKIAIRMTITDIQSPHEFWTNDDLRVTVNVFLGNSRALKGVVNVTSNDSQVRQICGITVGRRWPNYCGLGFPNPGTWIIKAQYETEYELPAHFVGTQTLKIQIRAAPPTTLPQATEQATVTMFDVGSTNQEISGNYYPIEIATVKDANSLGYPENGTITFEDATGAVVCVAQVTLDPDSSCFGGRYSAPPPNPVTAYYSGTQLGYNDTEGSWYAPSSTSAVI